MPCPSAVSTGGLGWFMAEQWSGPAPGTYLVVTRTVVQQCCSTLKVVLVAQDLSFD